MAKTQPGGYYLAPNGVPHDAWNRPVEKGVAVLNAPIDPAMQPREAGTQPIGGFIDSPLPGSDQYRLAEARLREQVEANEKERQRLADEQEKLRKGLTLPLDMNNLQQILRALSQTAAGVPAAAQTTPTREEHVAAGEAYVEKQEELNERLEEISLAIDTNQGDEPAKLDKSGQRAGEADMAEPKAKGKSKKED